MKIHELDALLARRVEKGTKFDIQPKQRECLTDAVAQAILLGKRAAQEEGTGTCSVTTDVGHDSCAVQAEVVEDEEPAKDEEFVGSDSPEEDLDDALELLEQCLETLEGVLRSCTNRFSATRQIGRMQYQEIEVMCDEVTNFLGMTGKLFDLD